MKQRHAEAFLKCADLAADRGLTEVQRLAGMGKAAGFGYRVVLFARAAAYPDGSNYFVAAL